MCIGVGVRVCESFAPLGPANQQRAKRCRQAHLRTRFTHHKRVGLCAMLVDKKIATTDPEFGKVRNFKTRRGTRQQFQLNHAVIGAGAAVVKNALASDARNACGMGRLRVDGNIDLRRN